jgi:hypothetical protein
MSDMLPNGEEVVRRATGHLPEAITLGDRIRRMRTPARAFSAARDSRAFETPTMRMGFLSMKQLIYLERYGRMYIPDETLLGDPKFLRRVLAE